MTPIRQSLVLAALLTASCAVEAGVAYQVDSSPNSRLMSFVGQFGNQIVLKGDDSPKLLTDFTFDYQSNYSMSKGLIVRFYANDGGGDLGIPGTLLYQSAPQDIKLGTEQLTISYNLAPIPKAFTYTVEFLGNDGGANEAGLLTPDTIPSTGQAYDDFWLKNTSGWQLRNVLTGHAMMTAKFTVSDGTTPVPPTVSISSPAPGQVVVSWTDSSFKLQRRDLATSGNWSDVPGVTGTSATFSNPAGAGFFRLLSR